jgi:hypothetical protein
MPYDPSRLDGPSDRRRPVNKPVNKDAYKSPASVFGKQARLKGERKGYNV